MALEAPMRSSVGSALSAPDMMAMAANSITAFDEARSAHSLSSAPESQSLYAQSNQPPPSSTHLMSPATDAVGPSPVTSNGTATTDFEVETPESATRGPNAEAQLMVLRTNIPDDLRRTPSEEAVSVIHAPEGFRTWSHASTQGSDEPISSQEYTSSPLPDDSESPRVTSHPHTTTHVNSESPGDDPPSPHPQRMNQAAAERERRRSSRGSSLELIPEVKETDDDTENEGDYDTAGGLAQFNTTFDHYWNFCQFLSHASFRQRREFFAAVEDGDAHKKAWKCCWKLCKWLHQTRDDPTDSYHVHAYLALCRELCQALFEIRPRVDEATDAVLRASFELNNHYYNTLYTGLATPATTVVFFERVLEFYIALCYRLIKQRSERPMPTDMLLIACWDLNQRLLFIREAHVNSTTPDEELFKVTLVACGRLLDRFRNDWYEPGHGSLGLGQSYSISPPIPTSNTMSESAYSMSSRHSKTEGRRSPPQRKKAPARVPETPLTEFEDTPITPGDVSPQAPNILVLGMTDNNKNGGPARWSSSASQLSNYSHGSTKTSSTATTTAATDDLTTIRIKVLVLKAAMNIGFRCDSKDSRAVLHSFVKHLPPGSFGSSDEHVQLLRDYKHLVMADSEFRATTSLPVNGKRFIAVDVAQSVESMAARNPTKYAFLRQLYELVFGFSVDEAATKGKAVSIGV